MKETIERNCLRCGTILHGRMGQKFCSTQCRNNYNNMFVDTKLHSEKTKKKYHEDEAYRNRMKELRGIRDKERRRTDPLYKLTHNIKSLIYISLFKNGHVKSKRTEQILGCTYIEFRSHLESLFEPWMTWNNYGLYNGSAMYGWDIDHIIPASSAKNESEILLLNHYTNLQPLCSYKNRNVKRNKF
jgi:endogenous inhibitor of DNA gyrase (YacG/DUF329 family)